MMRVEDRMLVAAVVSAIGCGPAGAVPEHAGTGGGSGGQFLDAAQACLERPEPEIRYPAGIDDDLLDRAISEAHQRLERFVGQPQRGFAFRGRLEVEVDGIERVGRDAIGALTPILDDRFLFQMRDEDAEASLHLTYDQDSVTISNAGPCPASLPKPEPGRPFVVPPTTCRHIQVGDVTISVHAEPMPTEEITWDVLLQLNELRSPDAWTPYTQTLEAEQAMAGSSLFDEATYKEGSGEVRTFVDYRAEWSIDIHEPSHYCLLGVEIVHAETCTFPDGAHWHGRYDVGCEVHGTFDGRPDWADPY